MSTENTEPGERHETELQAKIRASLKKHKQKPGVTVGRLGNRYQPGGHEIRLPHKGILKQYKAVAAEVGCTVSAVMAVEEVERAYETGRQQRESQVVVLPFNQEVPDVIVQGFEGWVLAFARLSLMINGYLQVARVTGASMPAAWLADMRDKCETAQRRADDDAKLKKLWPDGPPAGSGHFPNCKAIEHDCQ